MFKGVSVNVTACVFVVLYSDLQLVLMQKIHTYYRPESLSTSDYHANMNLLYNPCMGITLGLAFLCNYNSFHSSKTAFYRILEPILLKEHSGTEIGHKDLTHKQHSHSPQGHLVEWRSVLCRSSNLHTKLVKPCPSGPGFMHRGTVILDQNKCTIV